MTKLSIGPDLASLKQQAEAAIDDAFGKPLDGYALKIDEARRLQAGGASDLIMQEARLRHVTPQALAQAILTKASASAALELKRIEAKLSIRTAANAQMVRTILKQLGISMPGNQPGF